MFWLLSPSTYVVPRKMTLRRKIIFADVELVEEDTFLVLRFDLTTVNVG